MLITAIMPITKNKSKVLVDQDLAFSKTGDRPKDSSAFALYNSEIRKFHLAEGGELSPGQYEEILMTVLIPRAKKRMLFLLTQADRTVKELEEKLAGAGYPAAAVQAAIAMAREYGYINEASHGARYVDYYGQKKSRRQLVYDMEQKGFDRELISALLEENPVDEEEQIRKLLQKSGFSAEKKEKAIRRLARKGYACNLILRVINELEQS